jgi:hypothetical protein
VRFEFLSISIESTLQPTCTQILKFTQYSPGSWSSVPIAQARSNGALAVEMPRAVLDLTFIRVSKLLSVFESQGEAE